MKMVRYNLPHQWITSNLLLGRCPEALPLEPNDIARSLNPVTEILDTTGNDTKGISRNKMAMAMRTTMHTRSMTVATINTMMVIKVADNLMVTWHFAQSVVWNTEYCVFVSDLDVETV